MNRRSIEAGRIGPLACAALSALVAMAGCGHDWDALEPQKTTGGAGAGAGGASAGAGGTGGSGGAQGGTSGSGGAGASGGVGGKAGTGGSDQPCDKDADCPKPANPCLVAVCDFDECDTDEAEDGTVIAKGNADNCLDMVCEDGQAIKRRNFRNCNDPVPDNCRVPTCDFAGVCDPSTLMDAPEGYACKDENGMPGQCDDSGLCF